MDNELLNIKNLRNTLNNYSDEQIDDLIQKISIVKSELSAQRALQEEQEFKKLGIIKDVINKLKDQNISLDEVKLYADQQKRKDDRRSNPKAKYKYTDLDGILRTWTGRGKVPTTMQKLMQKKGTSLEV